jgi:hypothetical protein
LVTSNAYLILLHFNYISGIQWALMSCGGRSPRRLPELIFMHHSWGDHEQLSYRNTGRPAFVNCSPDPRSSPPARTLLRLHNP